MTPSCGATIVMVNTDQAIVVRRLTTSASGEYVVPLLPIGPDSQPWPAMVLIPSANRRSWPPDSQKRGDRNPAGAAPIDIATGNFVAGTSTPVMHGIIGEELRLCL